MVNIFLRCLRILGKRDRKKYLFTLLVQLSLAVLDLLGVAILGILGAIAIRGVQSQQPGDTTKQILEIMGMSDLTVQMQVAVLGSLAMLFLVGRTLFSMVMTRKILHFLSAKSAVISADLLSKMLANENSTLQNENAVKLQYILGPGVSAIAVGILGTVATMLGDLSVLIVISAGVMLVNFEIALLSLFIFGSVGILLYFKLHLRAELIGRNFAEKNIFADQMIAEIIYGNREIYVRNRRYHYLNELRGLKEDSAFYYAENAYLPNIGKYVIEITVIVGGVAVSAVQFLRLDAAQAVAGLAIFLIAGTRIAPALLRLQQGFITIKSHIGVAGPTLEVVERVGSKQDLPRVDQPLNTIHDGFVPKINISNLQFRYSPNSSFGINISELTINPGETIAIVGPSGAGKSTFVDLLLGISIPDSGDILISSVSPEDAIAKWPGAIGYVPQTIHISNASVTANIGFGYKTEDIDMDCVSDSLISAQLIEFVSTLPEKLNTIVGDRGSKLSGGQRQRLGIARALYTKPKLLILDEATSALDGIVENDISLAISNIKSMMSIVLIAHRLSTVKLADKVIYMRDGKIEAMGSFEELRRIIPDFDKQAKLSGF